MQTDIILKTIINFNYFVEKKKVVIVIFSPINDKEREKLLDVNIPQD